MAAIVGQALQVARHIAAGHHIEDDIHAALLCDPLHFGHEIAIFIVDGVIRTDCPRRHAFIIRTASDDYFDTKQLTKLDRHGADTAGSAMNQYAVAFAGIAAFKDIMPYGE